MIFCCHLSFSKYYRTSLDPSKSLLWVKSRRMLLAVPLLASENAKLSFPLPKLLGCRPGRAPDPCPHQLSWQCKAPPGLLLVPGGAPHTAQETHPKPKPPAPSCMVLMQIAVYRNDVFPPLVSVFSCTESSQLGIVFWLFSRSVPCLCIFFQPVYSTSKGLISNYA